jgi:hypothetical protein
MLPLPAVEVGHLKEHANLAVLIDKPFERRNEMLIVLVRELATDGLLQARCHYSLRAHSRHVKPLSIRHST